MVSAIMQSAEIDALEISEITGGFTGRTREMVAERVTEVVKVVDTDGEMEGVPVAESPERVKESDDEFVRVRFLRTMPLPLELS